MPLFLLQAKIDYIYFTGDIVSHKIWATNKKYNSDAITKVMQQFKDTYGSIPVYPVLGNHESHPASVYVKKMFLLLFHTFGLNITFIIKLEIKILIKVRILLIVLLIDFHLKI